MLQSENAKMAESNGQEKKSRKPKSRPIFAFIQIQNLAYMLSNTLISILPKILFRYSV